MLKSTTIPRAFGALVMAVLVTALASACAVEVEDIRFGKDQCHSCRMAVVDRQHAAQFVTAKGKQFKFDSIECMNESLNKDDFGKIAHKKVAAFGEQRMIDAEGAFYLVSKAIRSPMGANLSAFESSAKAEKARKEHGGKIFRWSELDAYLKGLGARKPGPHSSHDAHASPL